MSMNCKFDEGSSAVLIGKFIKNHYITLVKVLNKHGLYKGQPYILTCLIKEPRMTQNELAKKLDVTKSTMGTSLKRMEKKDFIVREQDEEDSRCNRISITEKGRTAFEACNKDLLNIAQAMFSKISKDEEEMVNDIFRRLIEGIQSYEP